MPGHVDVAFQCESDRLGRMLALDRARDVQRLLEVARGRVDRRQLALRLDQVGLERQGLAQRLACGVLVAGLRLRLRHANQRLRQAGRQLRHLGERGERLVHFPGLQLHLALRIQDLRLVGQRRDGLLRGRGGLAQLLVAQVEPDQEQARRRLSRIGRDGLLEVLRGGVAGRSRNHRQRDQGRAALGIAGRERFQPLARV
ncbi:MAG: hypothetical protein JF585_13425, partial [Burkholderiales bacterium]|nr:hypothetical protein [Burkholderiales bacterium]